MKFIDNGDEIVLTFYPTINKSEKILNLILLNVMGLCVTIFLYLLFFVDSGGNGDLLSLLGLVFTIVVFRRYLKLTYLKEIVYVNRQSITIKKSILLNMNSKTYETKYISDFEITRINPDIDVYDSGTSWFSFKYNSKHVIFGKNVYSWEIEKVLNEIKRLIR